ncbi:hypothetical protein JYG34_12040 [Pseudomonas entomophila]|uniref:hypothetical protein n=1 Tax=Pseudomonas entomophila TaxID=312306 RepID=UPI001BCB91BC|nr:hypothetical protein [Pseudomonas entomophila]QVM93699.1 hypothetical protein JYG34_12040 [Pseudomonas entomophila]
MNKISTCLHVTLMVSALAGCATQDTLDTRHLTRFDDYHANLDSNGVRYTLDSYIIPFQNPFYISVQRDDGKPLSVSEAANVAQPYIEPRGCTAPVVRRADLDRSNGAKTQWLIGIEC